MKINTRAFDFLLLQNTVGTENVTPSIKNYVALLPSLQTYVVPRAVTEQTVTQSRRQVKFSVSKWLKLTQFHLLTPFFD